MVLYSAIFYCSDIDRTEKFYTEKLDFKVEYKTLDKFISFIFDNGVRLGIKKPREEREVPGYQTIFIEVEDINDFYKKIQDKGLDIYKQLVKESWATEFSILDPDGNKLLFRSK